MDTNTKKEDISADKSSASKCRPPLLCGRAKCIAIQCRSFCAVRVIKSRRMRSAGHAARVGEMKNAYKILFEKFEGKRPLGRPRLRWEIILEWILRKEGGEVWTGCIWLRIRTSGRLLLAR
jgi:hypothetical protein